MSDWAGENWDGRPYTAAELDRHFSPTSLDRRVGERLVEQVSWNSWGAFYKRWDDDGNLVESRRANNADYFAAQRWSARGRENLAD